MPELADIRSYMRQRAEEDRARHSVEVEGATLEDALVQATIELGLPLRKIEYEILSRGSKGFMGVGKKTVKLMAYELSTFEDLHEASDDFDLNLNFDEPDTPVDMDGQVFVHLSPDGVLLKVVPPVGTGKKVNEKAALEALEKRGITDFNKNLVSKVVKNADSEAVKVGDYQRNPANDASISVEIRDADMKAYMVLAAPKEGGADLSASSMLGFIKANAVIHGIKEDILSEMEDSPVYNNPILIAEGTNPVPGKNARISYNFDVDRQAVQLKEKNGRVDFKEMNLIQNVVEGQVLAKKVPADDGIPGRTVLGKQIPTKPGADLTFDVGKNVRLAENNTTAIATINGQVIMTGDKINVEPIYVVEGDVNLKSGGNVIFLGTVVVNGSVEDGFKVKASGNIEVMGNVGKAELDAEGDIIVHQGINGKGEGLVRSSKGVWAKFIENSVIDAGELVFASDGIINSNVDSNKHIVAQGKRATIVGGRLRAAEEIRGKTFGSLSGSETILEVGYDPKSSSRMAEIDTLMEQHRDTLEDIERNLATLENLKKIKRTLPEDKEAYLTELTEKKHELIEEREKLEEEQKELREYLDSLKITGKISASSRIYPGVKVVIKDASLKIRNEFKATTFINENHEIRATKYEEASQDFSQR